ncbi:MAG TPA: class I SAM-dependent methyltransferase [Flavobacteriales bacterium]
MHRELKDAPTTTEFYEERFAAGYMDEWPTEKKQRVFEVIRSLGLPAQGDALDFGCGTGVFSEVLAQALPGWRIHGCDVSSIAIEKARERFPAHRFFVSVPGQPPPRRFDLVFSHHVLEHVFDIARTVEEIGAFLRPSATVLHILPCGNPGSFEHRLAGLRIKGIDPDVEDRFFFEDEGHLRRLTTDRCDGLMATIGLHPVKASYANQYHGSIQWMSRSPLRIIRRITDPTGAVDASAAAALRALRRKLLLLFMLQLPVVAFHHFRLVHRPSAKHYAMLVFGTLFYPLSYPVHAWLDRKAATEWRDHRQQRNGSEMYLHYAR